MWFLAGLTLGALGGGWVVHECHDSGWLLSTWYEVELTKARADWISASGATVSALDRTRMVL